MSISLSLVNYTPKLLSLGEASRAGKNNYVGSRFQMCIKNTNNDEAINMI